MVASIVGEHVLIRTLRDELETVAPTASTVLVTGETGTGKGLVARLIHQLSGRRGPFVHVDCTTLPENLMESELFGYERGAFTGANETRPGRFEVAAAGTIFLDEIGELEPRHQSKLLRVLQDRTFERLGSTRPIPMTAKVVAATNRDLERDVAERAFRADLYYRLKVLSIRVPPLRERMEDLPALVTHALETLSKALDAPCPVVEEEALSRLRLHSWPGNVRELFNFLERALIRSREGRLEGATVRRLMEADEASAGGRPSDGDGPAPIRTMPLAHADETSSFREWIREQERRYFIELISRFHTTRERTIVSGLPERTLFRKLRSHSLNKPLST